MFCCNDAVDATDASTPTPSGEDIHHFVELELTKKIGRLALKLHTGRSRNEQIATDMRLFVRDAIDATLERPRSLARSFGRTGRRMRVRR